MDDNKIKEIIALGSQRRIDALNKLENNKIHKDFLKKHLDIMKNMRSGGRIG